MQRSQRVSITLVIALLSGIVSWYYQVAFQREAGDLTWALQAAQDLLDGRSPYARDLPSGMVAYPLPAAIIAIPFLPFPREVAAGLFMGISTGLLAWGMLKRGKRWRLLVFGSFPYWQAVQVVNWSPLLLSIMFLPILLPLVVVKPHTGLPIFLSHLSWKGVIACGIVGIGSLLLLPDWPWQWLQQLEGYVGRPAVALLPFGPLVLLALIRWSEEHVRYFLYCALVPLRPFYDYILLWYLPTTYRQALVMTSLSWVAFFGWFFFPELGAAESMLFGLYILILLMLLWPRIAVLQKRWVRERKGDQK